MAGNSFGTLFKITTYGESHGAAIGVIIDGCPAGLEIDLNFIQAALDKRRPNQSHLTTSRNETDKVQIISGVFEGKSIGSPIHLMIWNENQISADYEHLKNAYRPSHADYTYQEKYGIRDYRGGGRSSARETAARVAAGAIASLILQHYDIEIYGYVSKIGKLKLAKKYTELHLQNTYKSIIRCPDAEMEKQFIEHIEFVKSKGDSVGGIVSCVVKNMPVGLGEPVFDKLHAQLGKAMLSINAVHGFEYGSGFDGTDLFGSEHNDVFEKNGERIITKTNHSGGIQGGISNGMDVFFNVAFKPTATIMQSQESVNTAGEKMVLEGKGRHDACVLPRAVPIVEAMTALVLVDFILWNKISKL